MLLSPLRLLPALLLALAAAACGDTGKTRPPPVGAGGTDDSPDPEPTATATATSTTDAGPPCIEGTREECKEDLVTGGVIGCIVGERACIGGKWTDCIPDPEELDAKLREAGLPVGEAGAPETGQGGAAGADAGA